MQVAIDSLHFRRTWNTTAAMHRLENADIVRVRWQREMEDAARSAPHVREASQPSSAAREAFESSAPMKVPHSSDPSCWVENSGVSSQLRTSDSMDVDSILREFEAVIQGPHGRHAKLSNLM